VSRAILQLQNAANWDLQWSYSVAAAINPQRQGSYLEIPPITAPFLLESHIIAVAATSTTARPHWKVAGSVEKKISTGIATGGGLDTTISQNRVLWLNKINLFKFTQDTPTYGLQITPKWWFKDITLTLWVYTGIESDTVTEQLNRIEFAVDEINR
jgi:hypothetical protein